LQDNFTVTKLVTLKRVAQLGVTLFLWRNKMSNIHNDIIKEKIYEQVLWELGPFEYFLSEEDFEELVQNVTQSRWEKYYD
tara:strand:- start:422 stop:661 length:240 start_codon:yes stop_codon:yes gene_type:complete